MGYMTYVEWVVAWRVKGDQKYTRMNAICKKVKKFMDEAYDVDGNAKDAEFEKLSQDAVQTLQDFSENGELQSEFNNIEDFVVEQVLETLHGLGLVESAVVFTKGEDDEDRYKYELVDGKVRWLRGQIVYGELFDAFLSEQSDKLPARLKADLKEWKKRDVITEAM